MIGSFEVVALALEPRDRIERFARHYLAQGASRVSLFFDGDERYQFGDGRIRFQACDAQFWNALLGERPDSVESRQRAVYRAAYDRSRADWCLIVDLDEYVCGKTRLDRFFEHLPPELPSVRFASAEGVFGPGDDIDTPFGATLFRTPIGRLRAPLVSLLLYGGYASLFSRGMLGHSRGKQALRTGLTDVTIDIHDSAHAGERIGSFAQARAAGLWLAHYDAIDFAQWAQKCARRLANGDAREMGSKRERQLRLFAACSDDSERRDLFRHLYGLQRWQLGWLDALGLIRRSLGRTGCDAATASPQLAEG